MSGIVTIATNAAFAAASIIQKAYYHKKNIVITKKPGVNNFVTDIDQKAEEAIIKTIKQSFPEHNILAEESGANNLSSSPYTWIIDPIDGTTNFIHDHPQYSISIAIRHHDQIIAGVILDPNRNELFRAELGKGAFLNDSRIRVSKISYLEDSLIATGFPTYDMSVLDSYLKIFKDMLTHTSGHRRCGSAALDLAFVASGRVDGYWEFNLKPWDFAAGYLLVKEAGGTVTDFEGNQNFWQSGNIIAGCPKISTELLKIIKYHLQAKA